MTPLGGPDRWLEQRYAKEAGAINIFQTEGWVDSNRWIIQHITFCFPILKDIGHDGKVGQLPLCQEDKIDFAKWIDAFCPPQTGEKFGGT